MNTDTPELRDIVPGEPLFTDVSDSPQVWMSHGDNIVEMPEGFRALASTDNSPIAALGDGSGRLGLQFHPEVVHTPEGGRLIHNFPVQRLWMLRVLDRRKLRRRISDRNQESSR